MTTEQFDSPLDPGIKDAVETLCAANVETFESCEGGPGHAYPEPTVRFHGNKAEGLRALAVALNAQLPVMALRRVWPILDREPTGPYWELTFRGDAVLTATGETFAPAEDPTCGLRRTIHVDQKQSGQSQDVEQIVQRLEALKNRMGGKTDANREIDEIAQAVRQLGQGQSESSSDRQTQYSR
jgi:hypothetical protein